MVAALKAQSVQLMVSPYHNMVDCTPGDGYDSYRCARVLGHCGALVNNVSCQKPSQCPAGTWDKVQQCIQASFPGVFAVGAIDGMPSPVTYGAGFAFDLWSTQGVKLMMDDLASQVNPFNTGDLHLTYSGNPGVNGVSYRGVNGVAVSASGWDVGVLAGL
jgi:hypothetical protein